MSNDYFLAEFKGTFRAPHPEGIRDANVTKTFHVKVKMKRKFLMARSLNGAFAAYYKPFLRKLHPEFLDTYQFHLVEAVELDGSKIDNPRALSLDGLMDYIKGRHLPINAALYDVQELRNQVVLYERNPKGQQKLQEKLAKLRGTEIEIGNELNAMDDVMVLVEAEPVAAAPRQRPGRA